MLVNLIIKNFILIENLQLSFGHKLTVLTGETGAGKSILLDALSFVLGARGDTGLIKQPHDSTSVIATFDLNANHPAIALLKEQGIIDSELNENYEIILRRTLFKDAKNKVFINDIPVNLTTLKTIGTTLIEIHGQFDNQRLLNPASHVNILDNFAGLNNLKEECKQKYFIWQNTLKEFKTLKEEFEKAKQDEEYLKHNLNELIELNLKENEEEELAEKRKQLMNTEKYLTSVSDAFKSLKTYGEEPERFIKDSLNSLLRIPDEAKSEDIKIIIEELENSVSNIMDVYERLEDILNSSSKSTEELESTEERFFNIKELARKHHIQISELPKFTQNLKTMVENIDNSDTLLNEKAEELEKSKNSYIEIACLLSEKRKLASENLSNFVNQELPALKLEKANFEVDIKTVAIDDEKYFTSYGIDTVYFMGATNIGAKKDFIHKIASGGELARFTLAIKVVTSNKDDISTFIFDEVDTGISGATAAAVGERLAVLSKTIQTLVITHSPQVAAYANHHFKVLKTYDENTTTTSVTQLNKQERITEIARIISGDKITIEALRAAETLLNTSSKV